MSTTALCSISSMTLAVSTSACRGVQRKESAAVPMRFQGASIPAQCPSRAAGNTEACLFRPAAYLSSLPMTFCSNTSRAMAKPICRATSGRRK